MYCKEQVLMTMEAKAKSARWAGRLKTLEKKFQFLFEDRLRGKISSSLRAFGLFSLNVFNLLDVAHPPYAALSDLPNV